ncbi:MAG: hypothetical protein JXJ04_24945 [Spirochaetales bacterium]|nr:hypothetical protein [Spirochaetales bacterium]
MMQKKQLFLSVLFLLLAFTSFSLELNDGNIKLILHKNIGRFSVYYLTDPVKKKYTSFFLDQDVRTSVLSIVIDNKIYRLGESGSFKEKIEEKEHGARFTWESGQLEISQDFTFITSSGAKETDGILITLSIKNISEKSLKVGVRYLFDTYLGESHNHHFRTNNIDNVTNETVITKENMINYWISQNIKEENVGLQVAIGNSTKPDKIIFANWKRLNETTWTYLSSESRDFSSRPYSINDSAVAHYYDPATIESGRTRKITLLLGNINEKGYENAESTFEEDADIFSGSGKELVDRIKSDIVVLDNLLLMINKKIESGNPVSDKDISIMEQIMEEIKVHMKNYENE